MLAKKVIEAGGSIHPLLIDASGTGGTGTTNPTVLLDNGKVLVNVRHVEYSLYHSELKKYCHPWGPLQYVHQENDMHLRTNNYIGTLRDDLSTGTYSKIDTSNLDVEPLWDFVGLEDVRIVRWNGKLYATGVRRDTTTNGQGRMELSEIVEENGRYREVSRFRIPAPDGDGSYCEKNWMPVVDMPFHYVKWCNPTQVVKVDIEKGTCETVYLGTAVPFNSDFRGGSQVIPYKGYRICLTHQTYLYNSKVGRKDGNYRHRFVVWDKDWNVVKYGDPFSFLEGSIEFCCGATLYNNDLLITFGFQDNSAFLLRVPGKMLDSLLDIEQKKKTVVDFFPYFHSTGRELLELRVNMLKDHVDKFVICESNKTQSGIPIEYELEKTIEELNLPKSKIHIIKLDIPEDNDLVIEDIDRHNCYEGNDQNITSLRARTRERMQKDSLLSVINEFDDSTYFIVSDSDEIIEPKNINFITDIVGKYRDCIIKIPLIHLEGRADLRVYDTITGEPKKWDKGMFICAKEHLQKATPTQIRSNVNTPFSVNYITHDNKVIEDMGWHFSWMGDSNIRKIKRESFTHYSDTLRCLGNNAYTDDSVKQLVESNNIEEGQISPSGELNTVLKKYPLKNLPEDIFYLSRVKKYLLPNIL